MLQHALPLVAAADGDLGGADLALERLDLPAELTDLLPPQRGVLRRGERQEVTLGAGCLRFGDERVRCRERGWEELETN